MSDFCHDCWTGGTARTRAEAEVVRLARLMASSERNQRQYAAQLVAAKAERSKARAFLIDHEAECMRVTA